MIAALSGEYDEQLEQLQYNYVHDRLEMRGASSINWPQVLAVYAVKTNSDDIEADEVVI